MSRKRKVKTEIISDEEDEIVPIKTSKTPVKPKRVKKEDGIVSTKTSKAPPKAKRVKKEDDVSDTTEGTSKTKRVKKEDTSAESSKTTSKAKRVKKDLTDETKCMVRSEATWQEHDLLAEKQNISPMIARNIIQLLKEENTIPFIARYRRHQTNDMSPEKLRDVKESYEEICELTKKAQKLINSVDKIGKLSPDLKYTIECCKNMDELEHIAAPFKPEGKRSLAERAKKLGLEDAAMNLYTGIGYVVPETFVNQKVDGLKTVDDVKKGLVHIIAHTIATNTDVLTFVRKLRSECRMTLESKKSNLEKANNDMDEANFENYFNFKIPTAYIKPHQVLAVNRGEKNKILSVKLIIPDFAFNKFKYFCENLCLSQSHKYQTRIEVIVDAVSDAYKRLISPLMIRQTRAELKVAAEKASVEVFSMNLKKMLLGTPLKGKSIMGIDPGFKIGCKIAVISKCGDLLDTGVIYPHTRNSDEDSVLVQHLLHNNNCDLIALGNGTACRETEKWLTGLIQNKYFQPLDVSYTIVSECGASIYSCGTEAKKEFPKLDPLLISAVSIARRVQDPLSEMVKVEPQHLGVGMYQKDINKKMLESALDEVVSECVSFVGVDINTASQCLLRRTAGLTTLRADNIIKHRSKNGPFTNRYQLKDVKGIGDKSFVQFAGFIRVGPADSKDAKDFFEKPDTNPLDCTWIHPESYGVVENIILKFKLHPKEIGQTHFIKAFTGAMKSTSIEKLSEEYKTSEATMKLITEVLSRPLDHDLRKEVSQSPVFKREIISTKDISVGSVLNGWVQNVTHFGAFVDIGVGVNGLLHNNAMKGLTVELNDRVEVKVLNLELDRRRIGLGLIQKI